MKPSLKPPAPANKSMYVTPFRVEINSFFSDIAVFSQFRDSHESVKFKISTKINKNLDIFVRSSGGGAALPMLAEIPSTARLTASELE